jgi:hypothetical protein
MRAYANPLFRILPSERSGLSPRPSNSALRKRFADLGRLDAALSIAIRLEVSMRMHCPVLMLLPLATAGCDFSGTDSHFEPTPFDAAG